jgi:hypothetical protein
MTPDQMKRIKAIEDNTELSVWQKKSQTMAIAAEKPTVVSKVKMPEKKDETSEN